MAAMVRRAVAVSSPAVVPPAAIQRGARGPTVPALRGPAAASPLADTIVRRTGALRPRQAEVVTHHAAVVRQARQVDALVKQAAAGPVGRHRPQRVQEALDATHTLNHLLAAARRIGPEGHRIWASSHRPAEALRRELTTEVRRSTLHRHPAPSAHTGFAIPPAARLDVVSAPHGQVRANGLAELFPAGIVHAQRSTAVVAGNNCVLQSETHYHVRRASLSPGPLTTDRGAREALRVALADPSDRNIDDLHGEMKRLQTPMPTDPTRRSAPVRARHFTSITGAEAVQVGDGSQMTVNTRIVAEQTQLPLVDLLAADRQLTADFVASLREPAPGAATARFLSGVLDASRAVDDRTVLDHSDGVPRSDTRLFSLFGVATVNDADAVMIGANNRLETRSRLHRADLNRGAVLRDLAKVGPRPAPTTGGVPDRGR